MTPENNQKSIVNVNRASMEELIQLPGVGKSTAQAIIVGRPYSVPEDLLEIQGLGKRSLERIRPFLAFPEVQADKPLRPGQSSGVESGERTSGERPTIEERLRAFGKPLLGASPPSTQVLWLVVITGALSVIVSVILSLSILVSINRTLNVERHAAVRELRSGFSHMESQMGDLAADLASIDQRLNAVEGLSGRMATLETEFELVQEDMDQAVIEVDRLTEKVSGISDEVMLISGKVDLFDAFLGGLRALMADLFAPVDTTTSP